MGGLDITDVRLRPAFTSRGDETIEAEVRVGSGHVGRATAPMGASAGRFEVRHLPRGGALEAIKNFNARRGAMIGVDASDYTGVSEALRRIDPTEDYSLIGGATAYAVSISAIDAAAKSLGKEVYELVPLAGKAEVPLPLGNVLGGGRHAGRGAPDIQEFLAVPLDPGSAVEAVAVNLRVHKRLRRKLEGVDPCFTGGRGDEGAWAPRLDNNAALRLVKESIDETSDETGVRIGFGLDFASSTLWDGKSGSYYYGGLGRRLSREEQISYVAELVDKFGLVYVEDPLEEEDFEGFAELTNQLKNKGVLIVGDDLFVTNRERLIRGHEKNACNGVILKVNQAGSLGEALLFAEASRERGYEIIASHRSGDTWDSHLAHIAIGVGALMIKSGVVGGERMSKLMELVRVQERRKLAMRRFKPRGRGIR